VLLLLPALHGRLKPVASTLVPVAYVRFLLSIKIRSQRRSSSCNNNIL